MHLVRRTSCRVCGSHSLSKVIDLGEQYLQGSFVKPGKEMPSLRRIPMELVRCNPGLDEGACGLLQMVHSVPTDILYAAYWYRSGTNQTMRSQLKGIVDEAVSMVKKKSATVLDIGCNDGTLLKCYPKQFRKFGIDPSDVAQEVGGGVTIVQDTFPSKALEKKLKGASCDIITSIAMFYDLEDPVGFAGQIRRMLSPGGVWVFENSYMPLMLRLNSYDTICHEHLEYYSLAVIEKIVRKAGLRVVKASLNESNGGSIRCHVAHAAHRTFDNAGNTRFLNELRQQEFDLALDTDAPYRSFQERIERQKRDLVELLTGLAKQGKKIHIYGASTKGNTILQWCGIDKRIIEAAADRNPDKDGARTLGTDIPILSEEKSRAMNPDYYLVLPWHFRKEFLERERDLLRRGVKMIFPLPVVEVVGA